MAYPISDVPRRIVYSGSAGVGPYAFTFEVLANTDIAVYKNTTLLTLTTDYTVSINTGTGTGTVTLVVAATGSDTVTLVGDRAIQRTSDFVTGGDLFADTLNEELDAQTIYAQQIDEKADRAIKSRVTDPTTLDMTLPAVASRANKLLGFTAGGAPTVSTRTIAEVDAAVGSFVSGTGNNAATVIYDPAGTNAVPTTVQAKLRETVSVKDFGAVGDGVADDTAAIQSAIASGAKQIHFAGGTYNLGTLNASSTLFNLNNTDNVRFVADGTVMFSFAFANNGTQPVIFAFTGCDSIRFDGNFVFTDSVGYNGAAITGVKAFKLNDNNTNFTFENVTFTGLLSGIEVAGTIDSRSVKQINANITATNLYYVLNCQQNGDDVIANIKATGCRREYFVYGVRNHRVKLTIIDKNTNNASLIQSYEYTNQTEDIDVDATVIWSGSPSRNFIALQHLPNTASGVTAGIRNINIRYNVYAGSANLSTNLGAVELTAAINGGADITANCNCITDKVTISGRTNGFYVYDVYSRYTLTSGNAKGEAYWPVNAKFSLDALKVLHHTKTYTWTPVLTGTGWSLGNGTAEGNYTLLGDGDSMFVWGKFTFGSTSTYNNSASPNVTLPAIPYPWAGEGSFNTGHPSSLTMVGVANLWDSSAGNAGYYDIPVKTSGATGTVFLVFHGNGGFLLGNNPFVWDTGDTIQFFAHVIHNNTQQLAP